MKNEIQQFYDVIAKRAKEKHVDAFEVYANNVTEEEYFARNGELERFQESQLSGVCIRLLKEGRLATTFTETLSDADAADTLFESAYAMLPFCVEDEHNVIPKGNASEHSDFYNDALMRLEPDVFKKNLVELERMLYDGDPSVKDVPYALMQRETDETFVMNSEGVNRYERKNDYTYYMNATFEANGKTKSQSGQYTDRDHATFRKEPLVERILEKGKRKLSSKEIASGAYPVILTNKAASTLFGRFLSLFFAESVQKNLSLFKGKKGTKVARNILTIQDVPNHERAIGSASFDGEGVPSRVHTLIENGVLQGFMHNAYTAHKDGTISTGHGKRFGYRSAIGTGPYNFIVTEGNHTFDDLVREVRDGVVITEIGGAGSTPVSGDFSLQSGGIRIREGALCEGVENFTLAGNFLTMLETIRAIGNDPVYHVSNIIVPSLFVEGLTIGGSE